MGNNSTLSAQVAEEIRVAMTRRRISGRQLAAQLGMSQTWLASRLNGVTPIDLNDLDRIAGILNVEVADLLPVGRRPSEGRLITTGRDGVDQGRVSNARKTHSSDRPHPIGHPKRTVPRDTTRRPVRFSASHSRSAHRPVPGGRVPVRTDREQGVTYGA